MIADDKRSSKFLLDEKKISSLLPIVKNHPAINEIGLDIIFVQHLGFAVRKAKYPTTNIKKKEGQIKDLIHRNIESEEGVDVFQMAGIGRFDISIINDDFLARHPNAVQGSELIKEVVKDITALIRKNAAQPDWYKKDDVKAQITLSVKNTLRRKGIKAELKEIQDEIMEQAEASYKEWNYRVA